MLLDAVFAAPAEFETPLLLEVELLPEEELPSDVPPPGFPWCLPDPCWGFVFPWEPFSESEVAEPFALPDPAVAALSALPVLPVAPALPELPALPVSLVATDSVLGSPVCPEFAASVSLSPDSSDAAAVMLERSAACT